MGEQGITEGQGDGRGGKSESESATSHIVELEGAPILFPASSRNFSDRVLAMAIKHKIFARV
jgi:hypothetical protein